MVSMFTVRLYQTTSDLQGRTIWIADAHRDDGKRFIVPAEEKADRGDLNQKAIYCARSRLNCIA
jgi:hypothetical protein